MSRKIRCNIIINKKSDEDDKNEEDRTDNKLSKMDNKIDLQDKKDNLLSNINNNNNNINDHNYDVDESLKCLLCGKVYKHLSGLCKHKKQKHSNYNNDIKKINTQKNEKSEIEKFKELFFKKQDYYEKQINNLQKSLLEKNEQLEILLKTSTTSTSCMKSSTKLGSKSKTKNLINNTNIINTTNTTNNNNGTINNINIVQFGKLNNNLSYDDPNNVI